MRPKFSPRFCLLLMSVGIASLLAVAGCHTSPPAGPPATPVAAQAVFVGNAACAECHKKEFDKHRGSRHDSTLHLADERHLGDLAPKPGPVQGTPYEVVKENGKFYFQRKGDAKNRKPFEYVLGSGKTGTTFVNLVGNEQLMEFRMSRFPKTGQWYITPGQETHGDLDIGTVHPKDHSKRCVLCHAAGQVEGSIRPDDKLFGVGCESCHGPGSLHIAAARIKNNFDLKVDKLGSWGARRLNEWCARCHRATASLSLSSMDANATNRFQPYGLMQSPCFQKSNDTLSCSVCHDPHKDASRDPEFYTQICLKCHTSPQTKAEILPGKPATFGGVCPVNKQNKCVTCHMPPRRVFPASKVPTSMADHLIWANGKKRK